MINDELLKNCGNLAWEIIGNYDTNTNTQPELSDTYGIPLNKIQKVTQDFGYYHTKRKRKKAMIRVHEFLYLAPYIK